MNLTTTINSVRKLFGLSLQEFETAVKQTEIGAEGVLMLPFLNGERVPALPNATGSILGLNSQNTNVPAICRAVIEAASYGLRYGLDLLNDAGVVCKEIRLVGGGAKSELWRQMLADIMETPVICPDVTEAGALGAAIQAAWCYEQQQGGSQTLDELCEDFVSLDNSTYTAANAGSSDSYKEVYQHYRQAILDSKFLVRS